MAEKPDLIEFMLRDIDLRDALAYLERWDALSDDDKRALGFKPAASRSGLECPLSPVSTKFH